MCGIAGFISAKPRDMQLLLGDLRHRGPDDCGTFSAVFSDYQVVLGQMRLSIIDLSANGHQPMLAQDGLISLVYNGEIYNFNELKKQYLADCAFSSSTDTEVILRLYQRFGIGCLEMLNGDFALAIYDQRSGKMYLARDRMGVKPLYYLDQPDLFAFASELKPLLRLCPGQPIDEDNASLYFVFKYVPGQGTLFRNIKRLPPGSYLELDVKSRKLKCQTYWQLAKQDQYAHLRYGEAQEILLDLLAKAIAGQLVADVPVGIFLSGGLDSSTISYFAKEHKKIRYYCARKNEQDLKQEGSSSDFYFAEKLSRQWNLDLQPIDIGNLQATRQLISKTIYYADDLIADGSQIPSFLITQQACQWSKVLLSGMGGDELFYGYAGHQISLLASYLDYLPVPASTFLASLASQLHPGKGKFRPYKRFLKKFGAYYNQGSIRYGLLNIVGDFVRSASVYEKSQDSGIAFLNQYFAQFDDAFSAISRFEMDNFLVKNLNYFDRMCMANSVEGRVPFLDYRLVELAYSLPREYKLSSLGRTKLILKDALKSSLPDYILRRRKAGFGMPLRSIFLNRNNVLKLLNLDFFAQFKSFSVESINNCITAHVNGLEDNSALIYALVSYQLWYELFIG